MLQKLGINFLTAQWNVLNNCVNFFHAGNSLRYRVIPFEKPRCKNWKAYNDRIYPPQKPGEPRRPAFVCHVNENVKYSYKKMWYIASLIRGMSIDEALKQLDFVQKKGASIAKETLLKAQSMAVEEHNVEFKSNLWVSESFVGKGERYTGLRRSAKGRCSKICYDFIHHFVTLEEGSPPAHYYHFKRPKSGQEMLDEWIQEMRNRKILHTL